VCNIELIFNLQEIDDAAKKFILLFNDKKIFAFSGEMGAGKTTFIHAACRQMGVTEKMSSPTYPIINQYKTEDNTTIFHIDLFRLKDIEEIIQTGVEECINSGECCFIEWPEKIPSLIPAERVEVSITPENQTYRTLAISVHDGQEKNRI